MKTTVKTSVKTKAANATVKTLETVAMPLHLAIGASAAIAAGTILSVGNTLMKGIEKSEGYLTEKLNGTPREEVATARYAYTISKMTLVADKASEIRNRAKAKLEAVKQQASDKVEQVKQTVTPAKAAAPKQDSDLDDQAVLDFRVGDLQRQRLEIQNSKLPEADIRKKVNAINKEIGKLRRNHVPQGTPAAAFATA